MRNKSPLSPRLRLYSRKGQNTAEYLVLLILVTVMSIGVFTVFGKTIRGQISNVVAAMTGSLTHYDTTLENNAGAAKTRADRAVDMGGVDSDELNFESN